jgi:hypothetical protein
MNMVGHHDQRLKVDSPAVIVNAVLHHETSRIRRQSRCANCAKSDEERAIISLVVRKAAAVLIAAKGGSGHGTISALD